MIFLNYYILYSELLTFRVVSREPRFNIHSMFYLHEMV